MHVLKKLFRDTSVNIGLQPPKCGQLAVSTKAPVHRGYATLTGLKGLKRAIFIAVRLRGSAGLKGVRIFNDPPPAKAGHRRFNYRVI